MIVMFQTLESRTFFHTGFTAAINFAPLDAGRAPGMLSDYGSTFDVRRGGISYGWNSDHTDSAVALGATTIKRNDTFIRMATGSQWEIGLDNGDYEVYVVAGDITKPGERMALSVEGRLAVAGMTRARKPFLEGGVTVTVMDGRLTIASAGEFNQDKINYVAITSTHATTPNAVTIVSSVPNASEQGGVAGKFSIERSGDLSQAITVPLNVSGTATNGVDYGSLGAKVVFAPGVSTIDLPIKPVQDNAVEGDETVVVTMAPGAGYEFGLRSASITISDTPSELGTLQWSTKAPLTVPRVEGMSTVVGNQLYVFGGYLDSTWAPAGRIDRYNLATNTWQRMGDMPERISHAGTATDGTFVYFAGGYPGLDGNRQAFASTNVRRYNPGNDTWTSLKPLPVARGGGQLYYVNNVLYYVGGSDIKRLDHADVWALNLNDSNANWVPRASLPQARNHFGGVVLNGQIYVIGGQTGQEDYAAFKSEAWRYDPSTNKWTAIAAVPLPTRSHTTAATFVHQGKILSFGGETASSVAGKPLALRNTLSYDPVTNKWATMTALPAARSTGFAGSINGQIVYSAGYNGGQFSTTTWVGTFV